MYRIPGSHSENRHKFFKSSPESNVSSLHMTTSKEKDFIVDSGASLHMMSKSDLTPEEQGTLQKSSDPSIRYYDDPYDRRSNNIHFFCFVHVRSSSIVV